MEVERGECRQTVWRFVAGTAGAASGTREKPPDLSLGTSCSGERRAPAAAWHRRTTPSRTGRDVHRKAGQIRGTDGYGRIPQSSMGRDQQKALGRLFGVLS